VSTFQPVNKIPSMAALLKVTDATGMETVLLVQLVKNGLEESVSTFPLVKKILLDQINVLLLIIDVMAMEIVRRQPMTFGVGV